MNGLKNVIKDEPVLIVGLVQSLIGVGTAFGLGWTAEQVAIVLAFTGMLLSVIARLLVTPTSTVDATVKEQVAEQVQEHDDTRPLTAEERATLSVLRDQRDRLEAEVSRPMTEMERVEASRRPLDG